MSDTATSASRSNSSAAQSGDDFPLHTAGFQGTPDEIERQWREQVYHGRGDSMRQLTVRAVIMGMILGAILSTTNIYIGLKAGWCFGVVITASILSFTIWNIFLKIRIARTPMTILENNCMQSTASAAGYSTGPTLISAFTAFVMINNSSLPLLETLAWVFFTAILGITMAIPMKRQLVNVEQLRFPTGTAAAETLHALYSHGAKAARAAKALLYSGLIAAASQFWADGLRLINVKLAPLGLGELIGKFNEFAIGKVWMGRTVMLNWDPIFIAAGALSGLRVTASMFLGSITCWMIFVPALQHQGIITGNSYRESVSWTLWGGVACMVTSGLLQFFMQWKSIVRAFSGLSGLLGRQPAKRDEMESLEAPMSWFLIGQIVGFIALAWLAHRSFQLPFWQSAIAVFLSFFLALVACRVTGETDTTPIGPMGKVTQLIFGGLSPGNMNINLMSANITSSAAIGSADLLTDLKSGYLLGANPRKQFLAQFAGIFVGTVATVMCWRALVPDGNAVGNDQFPAPAAITWKAVAETLGQGFASLHEVKIWSLIIGGAVGIILPLLSLYASPKWKTWIPSPASLGLAWTFHWYYGLLFFMGGLVAWIFEKKRPKLAEEFTFPSASGVIAGGSLMGLALIFWENGGEMIPRLLTEIKAAITGGQ